MAVGQDRVLAGYKKRVLRPGTRDEESLHMFFSPYRIPKGLTDEEVHQCILLYPLREAHKRLPSVLLPEELQFLGKRMTRKRFSAGIRKFVESFAETFVYQLGFCQGASERSIAKKT
ncbi:MAG TPA: hypothetical protein VMR73_01175 [Candidatus Paceibacterota bacterium]|nr:hypothetical protein [Candidatus Paceibacterota bacterium]